MSQNFHKPLAEPHRLRRLLRCASGRPVFIDGPYLFIDGRRFILSFFLDRGKLCLPSSATTAANARRRQLRGRRALPARETPSIGRWPTTGDESVHVYGMMYGMKKTTVYLPDDLKVALERVAAVQGRSEADLIRQAVRDLTRSLEPPRPRLPLFASGDPTLAERVDEKLARGFGE